MKQLIAKTGWKIRLVVVSLVVVAAALILKFTLAPGGAPKGKGGNVQSGTKEKGTTGGKKFRIRRRMRRRRRRATPPQRHEAATSDILGSTKSSRPKN